MSFRNGPMTCNVHIEHAPHARLTCETQRHNGKPEGYPVLHIGDVAVFPTVDQVRQLRDALDAWLAANAPQPVQDEAQRVADPNYVPTLEEAMRHPQEFVAGMIEEPPIVHQGLPAGLGK